MADALMGWDKTQSRWRAMHKGRRLQIRASELGGTNYTDTLAAANLWFREQKTIIDRESALETPRTNELEYLAELQSIQSDIKPLTMLVRNPALQSTLCPVLELLKHKEALLKKALQKPVIPPLDDTLRNPRHISPAGFEEQATKEATQTVLGRLQEKDYTRISREELQSVEGYTCYDHPQLGIQTEDSVDFVDNAQYFKIINQVNGINSHLEERTIAQKIQTEIIDAKDTILSRKKQELGLLESEYERGRVNQILEDQGMTVTESLQLDYHIDRFIEYQRRKCSETKISAGRLAKVISTIETYRKWSSIVRVDKIGTKEHIEGYYKFLSDRVVSKEIRGKYANNIFADFKMLIDWLFKEEVLKTYPVCLKRKGNDYKFHVVRQKPKVIPLKWVHKLLHGKTDDRMKLYMLLTLNCGFGASEIGQLTKDEYDPATGRITHKRCKTLKFANAPTVCYKLWNETKTLLDKEIANIKKKYPKTTLLLVNNNGKPLWNEYVGKDDGKTHKNDNITSAFKRLIAKLRKSDPEVPSIAYYQFRKTSASLIFNEPEYMGLDWLWLGHAPKTTAGQHYIAPNLTILDNCLGFLHDKIFGFVGTSDKDSVNMGKN